MPSSRPEAAWPCPVRMAGVGGHPAAAVSATHGDSGQHKHAAPPGISIGSLYLASCARASHLHVSLERLEVAAAAVSVNRLAAVVNFQGRVATDLQRPGEAGRRAAPVICCTPRRPAHSSDACGAPAAVPAPAAATPAAGQHPSSSLAVQHPPRPECRPPSAPCSPRWQSQPGQSPTREAAHTQTRLSWQFVRTCCSTAHRGRQCSWRPGGCCAVGTLPHLEGITQLVPRGRQALAVAAPCATYGGDRQHEAHARPVLAAAAARGTHGRWTTPQPTIQQHGKHSSSNPVTETLPQAHRAQRTCGGQRVRVCGGGISRRWCGRGGRRALAGRPPCMHSNSLPWPHTAHLTKYTCRTRQGGEALRVRSRGARPRRGVCGGAGEGAALRPPGDPARNNSAGAEAGVPVGWGPAQAKHAKRTRETAHLAVAHRLRERVGGQMVHAVPRGGRDRGHQRQEEEAPQRHGNLAQGSVSCSGRHCKGRGNWAAEGQGGSFADPAWKMGQRLSRHCAPQLQHRSAHRDHSAIRAAPPATRRLRRSSKKQIEQAASPPPACHPDQCSE